MCINVGSGFVCFCVIEYSRAAGQVMDFTPDYLKSITLSMIWQRY